jgi:hypothetical protein
VNIIELVKSILQEFPKISEIVCIDSLGTAPDDFGLYPTGDKLVKTDVLGNETREHTFILYAIFQSFNDYDRLVNSGTLLELQMWLERHALGQDLSVETDNKILSGKLNKLTCANGMLYNIPEQNTNGGVQYQLQITAEYKIESEDF